ncbi:hypothetical protein [Novosphingobium sp. MD-1]|uniref:hypothetical protein n=1 Tax=Novosphingobium sp. MD-1 TaxID=1630648 RepID=UPI0011C3A071|nr:hypothetical protein [Novosphingobium sp. MD-1]
MKFRREILHRQRKIFYEIRIPIPVEVETKKQLSGLNLAWYDFCAGPDPKDAVVSDVIEGIASRRSIHGT